MTTDHRPANTPDPSLSAAMARIESHDIVVDISNHLNRAWHIHGVGPVSSSELYVLADMLDMLKDKGYLRTRQERKEAGPREKAEKEARNA